MGEILAALSELDAALGWLAAALLPALLVWANWRPVPHLCRCGERWEVGDTGSCLACSRRDPA